MDDTEIKYFIEAALLAAGRPLSVDQVQGLFDGRMAPEKSEIRKAVAALNEEYEARGIVIGEVASGFRIQVKASMADRLQKLWEDRPPRYSRALFETLALIAYRQPITRGEIEEVRGVSVSSNIIRSLAEREWIRVVGHRDVPGRPAMFGTTRLFLDYFGLKKLDDLPPLADLSDWESLRVQLNLPAVEEDEGIEMPEIPTSPMLDMEEDEDPDFEDEFDEDESNERDESDDIESAYDDTVVEDTVAELVSLETSSGPDTEKLLVSKWPDPARSVVVDSADDESVDEDGNNDKESSAGGG